jgi:hypothetical protein
VSLTYPSEQCSVCRHLIKTPVLLKGDGRVMDRLHFPCQAFAIIPRDIARGDFDHRKPHKGDSGIRWAPAKPSDKHPRE